MRYIILMVTLVLASMNSAMARSTLFLTRAIGPITQGAALANNVQLSVTIGSTNIIADGVTTTGVAVQLLDNSGTAIPGQTITLAASGGSSRFGVATGVTDSLGRFSTTLKSTQAGVKTITATAYNRTACAEVTFVAGPPQANKSFVQIAPGYAQVADGNMIFSLTAKIADDFGNPVPGFSLTPSSDNANAVFSPSSGSTQADGTFSTKLTSTRSGKQNIGFTVGSRQLTSGAIFLGGAPDSSASTLTVSPNSTLQADGNDAFTMTVQLRDKFNNPVNAYPVTLYSDGVAVLFTPAQGSTNSSGSFTSLVRSKFVGTTTLGYNAGPLGSSSVVTFVVGTPKAATSTVTTTPAVTPATGSDQATIVGTLRDASGNPVPNFALNIALSGGNNVVSNGNCVTDANGQCSFTASSTKAESKIVLFTSGTLQIKGTALFAAGTPDPGQSAIISNTHATLVADGASAFLLGVKLADAQGNPVTAAPVSMSSTTPADLFKPASGKTNAVGVFSTQLSAKDIGQRTITAAHPSLAQQGNFTFGLGPMSVSTSTFVATPNGGLTADGTTQSTLTATIKDSQGRILPGLTVAVSSAGTNDTISNPAPVTDSSGQVTVTITSTRAERKKLSLTSGRIALTTYTTFVAGTPNQTVSSLVSNTGKPVAGPQGAAKMQVTVMDAFGNFCPNTAVAFSATGTDNTFSLAGGNTNAFGYLSTTLSTTKSETKTVSAQVGGITITQPVFFAAAAPNAAYSNFTASPNSGILANGTSSATLLATIKDAYNNSVVGQSVYIYVNDRNVTAVKRSGSTDASGQFTTTLVSTTAGAKAVSLQAGAASKMITVSFVPAASSSLDVIDPHGLQNDGWVPWSTAETEETLALADDGSQNSTGRSLTAYLEDPYFPVLISADEQLKNVTLTSFNALGAPIVEQGFDLAAPPIHLQIEAAEDGGGEVQIVTLQGHHYTVNREASQVASRASRQPRKWRIKAHLSPQ